MTQIRLLINGEQRQLAAPLTVGALLQQLDMAGKRVAVEVNREIVPRSRHDDYALTDNDQIEVVQAIGGG